MTPQDIPAALSWRRADLHIHTPASIDYQQPGVSILDILRRAEERELDIIALTDHNSVRGYADLWREIEDLELLEYLGRIEPAEAERLADYRRLLSKLLVLPGFEFTATFGFHILAIFPEGTSVRLMEHLLLLLGVPEDRFGSGEVGATSDVLRAYEVLDEHGALVIGAHVNSTHGIAMQGLRFGGQTKIAYTQSEHLHALEVTDLQVGAHRRSTARFFNGSKPEYSRRMHCIQGSDAHRLDRDPQRETNLGVGDRVTELQLPDVSFQSLADLFRGDDFSRTRPAQALGGALDEVREARETGNTVGQAFHESLSTKRAGMSAVLRDVVALANTDGGTVFVGVSPFEKRPIAGVSDAKAASAEIEGEVQRQISPALAVTVDTIDSGNKQVLAIRVPSGSDKPYALDPAGIFVRHEGESTLARRDEIVGMVREAAGSANATSAIEQPSERRNGHQPVPERTSDLRGTAVMIDTEGDEPGRRRSRRGRRSEVGEPRIVSSPRTSPEPRQRVEASPRSGPPRVTDAEGARRSPPVQTAAPAQLDEYEEDAPIDPIAPATGIELLDAYEQDGVRYYSLHDLGEGKYVHNVTRNTSRGRWRAAISDREDREFDEGEIRWFGDYGLWRTYKPRGAERRYNLVYGGHGDWRVFYGVGEDGLVGAWRVIVDDRQR